MSSKEQTNKTIITNHGTFIKIDETLKKYTCLECTAPCSGYWFAQSTGVKRPYPFCRLCVKKGLNS